MLEIAHGVFNYSISWLKKGEQICGTAISSNFFWSYLMFVDEVFYYNLPANRLKKLWENMVLLWYRGQDQIQSLSSTSQMFLQSSK